MDEWFLPKSSFDFPDEHRRFDDMRTPVLPARPYASCLFGTLIIAAIDFMRT